MSRTMNLLIFINFPFSIEKPLYFLKKKKDENFLTFFYQRNININGVFLLIITNKS